MFLTPPTQRCCLEGVRNTYGEEQESEMGQWFGDSKNKEMGMKKIKNPRIRTWTGEEAQVYGVAITVREYHLRLDQMVDAIYIDFSQLSKFDPVLESSSNQLPNLIHAKLIPDETVQGLSPDQSLRLDPQEVLNGVA